MYDRKEKRKQGRKLITRPSRSERNSMPPKCRDCIYFRPDFRYRKCLYAACPLGKNSNAVFRNRPLKEEKIIPEGRKDDV